MSQNHKTRQGEGSISANLEQEVTAAEEEWLKSEQFNGARKRRWDAMGKGSRGPHTKAPHLTESNIDSLSEAMVDAEAELCASGSENEDTPVVERATADVLDD